MTTDKRKIFIIDDDESVCRALKYLLMTFGYEVETFLSGKAFFSAVADTNPGCLILDIHLPELDGLDVQKQLKASGSKRKIIIITADKNGGLREQSFKAGAVGFLQKPFNDQALIDLINQAFEENRYDALPV
ncbi:MAG: response regulator [Candidatus Omnitrophica bacterium]|nr:response regulator [Candidatus Omnitrophota bacterium]